MIAPVGERADPWTLLKEARAIIAEDMLEEDGPLLERIDAALAAHEVEPKQEFGFGCGCYMENTALFNVHRVSICGRHMDAVCSARMPNEAQWFIVRKEMEKE